MIQLTLVKASRVKAGSVNSDDLFYRTYKHLDTLKLPDGSEQSVVDIRRQSIDAVVVDGSVCHVLRSVVHRLI